MNIFDKIGNALDPNKNGVSDFFKGVPRNIEQPVNEMLNKIRQQLEKAGKEIENAANSGKNAIYDEMKKRQGELVANVTRVGKDVEDGVKKITGEVEGAGKKAIGEIEDVGKKVVNEVEDEIKNVINKIQTEFESGAGKRALKLLYTMASDEDNPLEDVGGSISIISYNISDPAKKLRTIEKYVNAPPTDFDSTIKMLQELDVAKITVTVSGEVFSSLISFSVYATMDIVNAVAWFKKLGDHIKEAVKI